MTDRLNSLSVILEEDTRIDDETTLNIINAIKQFRGVIDVVPNVVDISATVARTRISLSIRNAVYKAVEEATSYRGY